ncbi:MAG TPA: BrnT family toxin [Magnetospirillaceae bacterium]|jgi:hypothetical protein
MFGDFEWDSRKRETNLEKHGIDFEEAMLIFRGPIHIQSARPGANGEERLMAIGVLEHRPIAVIFTTRDEVCRLISARRARQGERTAYRKAFSEKSS